jgi:ribosomal protein L40E
MYCTQCGAENPDSSRFCWQCGSELVPDAGRIKKTSRPIPGWKEVASVVGGLLFAIVGSLTGGLGIAIFIGAMWISLVDDYTAVYPAAVFLVAFFLIAWRVGYKWLLERL